MMIGDSTPVSIYMIRKIMARATKIQVERIPCCRNGCMAFTGTFESADKCLYCKCERFNKSGDDVQSFAFISPIQQVSMQLSCPGRQQELMYRHNVTFGRYEDWMDDDNPIEDIFDGNHYRDLVKRGLFVLNDLMTWRFSFLPMVSSLFDKKITKNFGPCC
ncbi:hypothetical protein BC829DRAFT_141224 [Chytridium lagenaria]|nr:hypothetical protein BC829DRAFT_141224 [Chytridium lagenaria]